MSPGQRQGRPAGGRRRALLIGGLAALVLVGLISFGVVAVVHYVFRPGPAQPPLTPAQLAELRLERAETKQVNQALTRVRVDLPSRLGAPAPAYSRAIFPRPLPSHQVFGYLPFWELSHEGAINYQDYTTIGYFSLGIGANGALDESATSLGWQDMQSRDFASFRSAAHAAHVRVLLTVATTDPGILDSLSSNPKSSAARLLTDLRPVLTRYSFDGLDLDLEGTNGADRAGFAHFVQLVAAGVHAAKASYTVAVDVYPQSAGDPNSFFAVKPLGQSADQLFIMGYDMEDPSVPSANAPLIGIGLSDVKALQTYVAAVPRSKLILGTPWYGVDWTVTQRKHHPATVDSPVTLVYSQIAAGNHAARWDPSTDTVWFSYSYRGRVHDVWFDNGVSLALKAALAAQYGVAGVGVWALGMDGGDSDLLSALVGGAPVVKLPLAG